MKTIFFALALFGTPCSAATIDLTYTGQVFGGGDNAGFFTFSGAVNSSFSGEPFTLTYLFDTTSGSYVNNGSSSQFTEQSPTIGLAEITSSAILTINGRSYRGDTFDCVGCSARASDFATTGSTNQSFSWDTFYHGPALYVSTSAINALIPGDITEAYSVLGFAIGSGQFLLSEGTRGGAFGDLRIDTAVLVTPLPAALPLFAAGLGIVTFLARRRKTTAVSPA